MIDPRRATTAVLTALLMLWTGSMSEASHHDIVSGRIPGGPIIAQHACGASERHIPIERVHPCVICAQASQRVSTPPVFFTPEQMVFVIVVDPGSPRGQHSTLAYLFSGKRGPPLRSL